MTDNKIAKQKAGVLELPKHILESSPENLRAFFSGYFDADGYASGHKKGYCLYSIDYSVLKDFQIYLSLNNIITTLSSEDRSKQGWQTMWSLHIYGGGSQKNAISQFNQSFKITNKNFIAKRDFVKTPYIPKDFCVTPHKCRVATPTEHVSFMTAQDLGNTHLQNEYINEISKIDKIICDVVELDIDTSLWVDGFILYDNHK